MQKGAIDYNQLLTALKAFDLEAFDTLYLHTRERLFAYSFSILKEEKAAQDLVQDLFIAFWEGRLFLQIQSDLVGYLVRAVRNRSLDYIRKEQNRMKRQDDFGAFKSMSTAPSDKLDREELGQELEAAISKLPPMAARVFRLHYMEKLSYKEISEQLHISSATISNHISRALKTLRQELKK